MSTYKKYHKKYYEKNKEKCAERNKKYYEKNKEKVKEINHAKYLKRKQKKIYFDSKFFNDLNDLTEYILISKKLEIETKAKLLNLKKQSIYQKKWRIPKS